MKPDANRTSTEPLAAGPTLADHQLQERYEASLRFLFDRINYERTTDTPYTKNHYRLTRMRRLLGLLHDPHLRCPVIHVAGTKGKGSVVWMLSEALRLSGIRVGRYTSPHLVRIEERFAVDGAPPSSEELISIVSQLREASEKLERITGESATFFELTTAFAWLYFVSKQTDVAVVEVGLGGRLDSTNVCSPQLTIITTIGKDHQKQLGDTLAQIAAEKAGIIKPGVPLVCGVEQSEPLQVIESVAAERAAPARWLHRDFHYRWEGIDPQDRLGRFSYEADPRVFRYPSSLPSTPIRSVGAHQAHNASLVCAACDWLRELDYPVSAKAVTDAFALTQAPARMELLSSDPVIIIDTAHNEPSIAAMVAALNEFFPDLRPRKLLFAVSHDKDYPAMLRSLLVAFDELVFTQFTKNPRAVRPAELWTAAQEIADREAIVLPTTKVLESPLLAFEQLRATTPQSGLICVAGSFFLAAEILEAHRGPV